MSKKNGRRKKPTTPSSTPRKSARSSTMHAHRAVPAKRESARSAHARAAAMQATTRNKNWKNWNLPGWKAIAVILGLLTVSATGLATYKKSWEEAHDLSVIGNGTHTVVQVHDPGCRLCRALKSNTEQALARIDSDIQYRIANIKTSEGRQIQHRYEVPHVTLLLFGPGGKLWRTLTGVKGADTLEHVFEQFKERAR